MTFECPVCKHGEVQYEDINPVRIFNNVGSVVLYYVSVCENCNNVYCYKIEENKENE